MSETKNALEHALVAVNERGQKLDQLGMWRPVSCACLRLRCGHDTPLWLCGGGADEKMRRLNDTSADFAKQCEQIARNAARGAL